TAPVLEVISLARTQATFGNAEEAEILLRRALAAHPDEGVLLVTLGALLRRLDPPRYSEAIECYRAARALRPDLGLVLSVALRKSKRAAEAEQICRDLVRRLAGHPEPHLYLGLALDEIALSERKNQKKLGEAEAAFRKAIELRPHYPEAYANLGIVLLDQNRPAEAEAAYRQAIKLRPNYPQAYYALGMALLDRHRAAEAEAICRPAIKLRPDYPQASRNLGA